jgi:Beta-lactamase
MPTEVLMKPVPEASASLGSGSEGSDRELGRKIDDYLDRAVAAYEFSGAVLVTRDGTVLYRKAFGLASRSFGKPNEVDTKFNLGSMNKMFTAVAISQLAQHGKLAFSDTVGKHLPAWPNARVRDEVTLHQLLTHTSGMGSYFNDTYQHAAEEQFRKVSDYRPLYADEALQFEPGSRWSYSNSGLGSRRRISGHQRTARHLLEQRLRRLRPRELRSAGRGARRGRDPRISSPELTKLTRSTRKTSDLRTLACPRN